MSTKDSAGLQTSGTTAEATENNARPDDCQCWNADLELACWPCYRAGFETQNPAEPAAEEGDD